jgi:NAD(P)-dependent dehydrogenase (short-subunit alcohol dehydrogenase family)
MQNGESFADEVAREAKVAATYVGQDLGDLAGSEAAVRKLAAEHGGIDILINNAALIINKPFEEFSLDEYEEQVRVNSSAAFAFARAVAPAMKGKGYGKIFNFCSMTLNGRWDGYVPTSHRRAQCLV